MNKSNIRLFVLHEFKTAVNSYREYQRKQFQKLHNGDETLEKEGSRRLSS